MVFRPRYPDPTITHTTLSCLVVFKCLSVSLHCSTSLACYNDSNGNTGYFNSLFYLAAP